MDVAERLSSLAEALAAASRYALKNKALSCSFALPLCVSSHHTPRLVFTQGAGKRKTYAGSWVEALNAAGYSCAGIDNRGCARSAGLIGYIDNHEEWVDDLVGVVTLLF